MGTRQVCGVHVWGHVHGHTPVYLCLDVGMCQGCSSRSPAGWAEVHGA